MLHREVSAHQCGYFMVTYIEGHHLERILTLLSFCCQWAGTMRAASSQEWCAASILGLHCLAERASSYALQLCTAPVPCTCPLQLCIAPARCSCVLHLPLQLCTAPAAAAVHCTCVLLLPTASAPVRYTCLLKLCTAPAHHTCIFTALGIKRKQLSPGEAQILESTQDKSPVYDCACPHSSWAPRASWTLTLTAPFAVAQPPPPSLSPGIGSQVSGQVP